MGWECQNCGTVWIQRRSPVHCEICCHRLRYEPRWREIRSRGPKCRRRGGVLTPSLKERVFERDGYHCAQCGESNRKLLTLDHVIPKSKGGPNTLDNLQTLCKDCNGLKADLVPTPGTFWPQILQDAQPVTQ